MTCTLKLLLRSNYSYNIVVQCVCHCQPFSSLSNILDQGSEPALRVQSHKGLHSGKLQPC